MKSKRLSPAAINALKEALCSIYWYKNELRSFLSNCLNDRTLVTSLDWNAYKRQIVSDLVDILCQDQEKYLSVLTKLCYETINLNNFSHLKQLEGGAQTKAQTKARGHKRKHKRKQGESKGSVLAL